MSTNSALYINAGKIQNYIVKLLMFICLHVKHFRANQTDGKHDENGVIFKDLTLNKTLHNKYISSLKL